MHCLQNLLQTTLEVAHSVFESVHNDRNNQKARSELSCCRKTAFVSRSASAHSCLLAEVAHQKYAVMSLQMTRLAGKKNQKMPLKILCATNLTWATIMQIVTIVHVNCPTWQEMDV